MRSSALGAIEHAYIERAELVFERNCAQTQDLRSSALHISPLFPCCPSHRFNACAVGFLSGFVCLSALSVIEGGRAAIEHTNLQSSAPT